MVDRREPLAGRKQCGSPEVDLIFNDVRPEHGTIAVRFFCRLAGNAMVQAIEVGPGSASGGAKPVPVGSRPR
jgi:hypothetical protein